MRTLSLSLIGSKCLGTYRNPKEYFVFGFDRLNINNIIHMYHADSYSRQDRFTNKVNEICTPLDLLLKTYKYNEILVAQNILNNTKLNPSYLVCYDEVSGYDIEVAKRLNLSIVLIKTKFYESHPSSSIDYLDDSYITDLNSLFRKETSLKQKVKKV